MVQSCLKAWERYIYCSASARSSWEGTIFARCLFFQAEDGIRGLVRSRGLGDVYKRQTLHWYDGGMKPPRPKELEGGRRWDTNGALYIGDKGKIYGGRLLPESRQKDYGKPPQKLERSPGHYVEWIQACKGGKPAGSNFPDHAGLLAQVVLMGNIALRPELKQEKYLGTKLLWDADKFGISQLHQLRGRIGRGEHPGVCLLVTSVPAGEPARVRLDAVAATRDGFELAEADLEQRREGDVLGAHLAAGDRDAAEFAALVAEPGVIVLDVRSPAEFASGHLANAQNIDVQAADFDARVAALPKDGNFAVYCRSGNRSATALKKMKAAGITRAAHLSGGIGAWQAAGYQVVS